MADNFTTDAPASGDGATFASDERAADSVHFPWGKIVWGGDDTFNKVDTSAPFPVQLRDSGGTAIGAQVDDAAGATDGGVPPIFVRDDALSALTPAAGDYVPGRVDANGALWVIHSGDISIADGGNSITVDNAGLTELAAAINSSQVDVNVAAAGIDLMLGSDFTTVFGTTDIVYAEDDATPATISGFAVMMERDDALSTLTPAAADWVGLRSNARGALWVELDLTNDVTIADGGNTITVDNGGTFVVQENGDALTALQVIDNIVHVEDTAHSTGESGAMVLAVRRDADTTLAGTDGDYAPLQVNAAGQLKVEIFDGGDSLTVDNADISTIAGAVSGTEMQVDIAAVTPDLMLGTDFSNVFGTTDIVYAEDEATPATISGPTWMMERDDTLATLTPAEGDWVAPRSDSRGAVWVHISQAGDDVPVSNGGSLFDDIAGTDGASGPSKAVSFAGTESGGNLQEVRVDSDGHLQIDILAGANLIGDVGISGARTSGGTTLYKNIDADESEDEIKGTAGQVYWIHAINLATAVRYLKFYNATAASVVVGTTVPDLTFPIPTQGDANGAGFTLSIPNGIAFGTAITIAATTGVADADSGAPGANEVIVNLGYA